MRVDQHSARNRATWDALAAADPLWAVLSFPEKKGRRWPLQEFMRTGEREIALLFQRLEQLGEPVAGRVLDFGCGVGRLTQALARRCPDVLGVDISPAMIALAERLNRYPDRARYAVLDAHGIEGLPASTFGLIYSNIVLQHIELRLSLRYLQSFFRLLRRDGLLVFQLPSHRVEPGTGAIRPMAESAYLAHLTPIHPLPARAPAGSSLPVLLRVRNDSDRRWSQPSHGPMAVGNHWLDSTGARMFVQDDARAPLLQEVEPFQEWPVLITVRVPRDPGRYVGEFDLVHEGVTWFAHKGSPTLRVELEATEARGELDADAVMTEHPVPLYPEDAIPPAPPESEPQPFEMHAIASDEVVALIRKHGAHLLDIEEDYRAGHEWVSYRYFVKGR